MPTPRTQLNNSKQESYSKSSSKGIGTTESRSPIKVVLKILIISLTIACIATAVIVAIQLNASSNEKIDGTSNSDVQAESNTTTIIPIGRTTVRTTTTTNNLLTLPRVHITYQYEENATAYLACPGRKQITILRAFLSCMNCNCIWCGCPSMIITTTMDLQCTNKTLCHFTVNQTSLFSTCFVSPRTLTLTYDCH